MSLRKWLYVGRERGDVVLLDRPGAMLDSRLCVADGGVRGRDVDPETLSELKLSMSAWEYDAPITFLLVGEVAVLDVVRQKGEAEEERSVCREAMC